jgi:anti-sigma regulatory factor (Ser/Thr protein kinase)
MAGDRGSRPGGPDDRGAVQAGSVSLEQGFDAGSLYALRSAVAAHAASAGLSPHRVYDVTAVAHELAANAVLHGAGHGRLRLWTRDGSLYCQVSDDGPAEPGDRAAEPAGDPVSWPVVHGHGLWVAGQVADELRTSHGPAGTTTTARFAINAGTGR